MQSTSSTSSHERYVILNNGVKMPRIGLGTFLGHDFEHVLKTAIELGYHHIDTARKYENEKEIGKVLKKVLSEGKIQRSELFITTKVWNDSKHDVESSLRASLADLQLDYVDLFLIHWPVGTFNPETKKWNQVPLYKTWKNMEECVKKGLCKSIGVSNFNTQILLDLLSYAEIPPVCNQIELHPYLTQDDLVNFCMRYGIHIVAYSPLCGGGLTAFGDVAPVTKSLFDDPILQGLAKKYNKSIGEIVLNWHLARGYTIIPKASSPARLKQNFECDNFIINPEDLQKISSLNCDFRGIDTRLITIFDKVPLFH